MPAQGGDGGTGMKRGFELGLDPDDTDSLAVRCADARRAGSPALLNDDARTEVRALLLAFDADVGAHLDNLGDSAARAPRRADLERELEQVTPAVEMKNPVLPELIKDGLTPRAA